MNERWRHQAWHAAATFVAALGVFVCLGFVELTAQQPDFTGVWTNYV